MPDTTRTRFRFAFACSFMGIVEYAVSGDGDTYRVETRRAADAYERSIYNGTEEQWQRDVVESIGLLHRSTNSGVPIPEPVVAAFNEWRATEHAKDWAEIFAHPEKYGTPDEDPFWKGANNPPAPVRGAVYEIRWNRPEAPDKWQHGHTNLGWKITGPATGEATRAG